MRLPDSYTLHLAIEIGEREREFSQPYNNLDLKLINELESFKPTRPVSKTGCHPSRRSARSRGFLRALHRPDSGQALLSTSLPRTTYAVRVKGPVGAAPAQWVKQAATAAAVKM